MTGLQKVNKTIKWLRKEFPARIPVYTVQRKLVGLCGDCTYLRNADRFRIRIHKTDTYRLKLDTVIHEWAHALTWWPEPADDHSAAWGQEYARIYRAWIRWDFGRGEK
jgi:hypothetical protein